MDASALQRDATLVDTHNDLILLVDHFDRRGRRDHFAEFWLPELRAGGVDVQVLPVFVERRLQSEGALRRTLLLIERIHELADEHAADVAVCRNAADIDAAVAAGKIAMVVALEGAHGIGQDPQLITTMARVGVRVASMAHLDRTFLADGSGLDDTSRGRLTPQGIEVFTGTERLGIVFDISHLGLGGVEHVLELATRPILATHSACRAITDTHRNLSDEHVRGIAAVGGVVNIAAAIPSFIDKADPSADRVVDHIEHIIAVAGIDYVGIGPDFMDAYFQHIYGGRRPGRGPDGREPPRRASIARPSDLPKITEAMVRRGFSAGDIRKVLGDNVMRVFREVMGIPAEPGHHARRPGRR